MKILISIIGTFCIIVCINLQALSQEEKFHQVNYGLDSMNISEFYNFFHNNSNNSDQLYSNQSNKFTLTLDADFNMEYVWIFNSDSLNLFYLPDTNYFQVNVPGDTINILTGRNITGHQHLILLKEIIVVNSSDSLKLFKSEANKNLYFEFLKEDYSPIRINAFAFLMMFNEVYNQGLAIVNVSIDTTTFWFRCNKSLSIFENEWSIKGKQLDNNGNLYLLNNSIDSIYDNLSITNDPINFSHADFQYHLPDSVEIDSPGVQVGTANYGYHFFLNDPRYHPPFSIRIMQDTSSDISLRMSKFDQYINARNTFGDDIITSEMRIGANNVKGFTTFSRYGSPFLISENKNVHIGVTPTFFYGQCQNTSNKIKISAPFNNPVSEQPFLSLTNDVLKHFPYKLKLFRNGNLLEERELNIRWGHPSLISGCDPYDLTFSVPSDNYEIVVIDDKNEIAGINGTTIVKIQFNLLQFDKNSPNMTLFQILSNNTISNKLQTNNLNIIRFRIEDDQHISATNLYFSNFEDSIWTELPLTVNNTYFEAQVPILASGYYSLKTICTDSSNNRFEMIMRPAFMVESSNSIPHTQRYPSKIELYQNYPNPFNIETNISFFIPNQFNKNVNISIYNILGQKIITLIDGKVETGSKECTWNGLNQKNQSVTSGIYILQLKGGDYTIRKKIILIK